MIPEPLAEQIVAAKECAAAALTDVELTPPPTRDRETLQRQANQMHTYAKTLDALAELFQQARDALARDAPGWLQAALASAADGERAHARWYRDFAAQTRRMALSSNRAER